MIVVPFLAVHLLGLELQENQKWFQDQLTPEYCKYLELAGPSYSGMENGECLGCAGFAFLEPHKAVVWSNLGANITAHNMIAIHRAVSKGFNKIDAKRIELVCRDLPAQKRWAEMLGMTLETPQGMDGYWFDGAKGFLYAKVKT